MLGHALQVATPEDRFSSMPVVNPVAHTVMVAAGRLDNRDDLGEALSVPRNALVRMADSALIGRAYERWGEGAPAHLFGDWSFAVWHTRERRLFVARDHLGLTGLFYWYRAPFLVFASDLSVLFSHPDIVPELDEGELARYLMIQPGDLDATHYKGVRLIPPAHCGVFDCDGRRVRPYWDMADAKPLPLASDAEYGEGFMMHFRRAVTARVRSERAVSSTLSSGLDSSAVTVIAAEILGDTGQGLTALTSVPRFPLQADWRSSGDERPLASAVTRMWDNIDHVLIDAASRSPVAALEESLALHPQPTHGAANLYWLMGVFEEARRRGAGVLLTGQLGNCGVSWSGGAGRILALMKQGEWSRGWSELSERRRHRGTSWVRVLASELVRPYLGPIQRRHALHGSAIAPDFRSRMRRNGELVDPAAAGVRTPREDRLACLSMNGLAVAAPMQAFGAAFGLEVRDPTADVRLLDYCLGVPDDVQVRGGGDRMLMRRSFAQHLPEAVVWNRMRGIQAADLAARVHDAAADVDRLLQRLSVDTQAPTYLNIAGLQRTWRVALTGSPTAARSASAMLLRDLLAGCLVLECRR